MRHRLRCEGVACASPRGSRGGSGAAAFRLGTMEAVFPNASKCLEAEVPPRRFFEHNTHDEWMYRLSDFVNGKKRDWRDTVEARFGGSVAADYARETRYDSNYKALARIVARRARAAEVGARGAVVVVHLRVGDVIDDAARYSAEDFVAGASARDHALSLAAEVVLGADYYRAVACAVRASVRGAAAATVALVYIAPAPAPGASASSLSHGVAAQKSLDYVAAVRRVFDQAGFSVVDHASASADDDVVFMAGADIFVPSTGGFSRLVLHCLAYAEARPAVVLTDDFRERLRATCTHPHEAVRPVCAALFAGKSRGTLPRSDFVIGEPPSS
mmetsp:Transcript_31262/g.108062  ORF Transcript_31262/g.108062 Transcript_31262/m.108062 type:complete len:330 (-) Transcript_31262:59-1048(-)